MCVCVQAQASAIWGSLWQDSLDPGDHLDLSHLLPGGWSFPLVRWPPLSVVKMICEMGVLGPSWEAGQTCLCSPTKTRFSMAFLLRVLIVCVENKALATGQGSFHLYPHQRPWASPGHAATSSRGLLLGHSAKLAPFLWFSEGAKRGESLLVTV